MQPVEETIFNNHTNHTYMNQWNGEEFLSQTFSLVLGIYFVILMIAGLVSNLLLMYIVSTNKLEAKGSNLLIISLSMCDILNICNLFFDATFMIHQQQFTYSVFICGLQDTILLFTLPLSLITMMVMTLEKLITLLFPYRHSEILTKRKMALLVVVIWLYSLLVACYPIITNPHAVIVDETNGHRECSIRYSFDFQWFLVVVNCLIPLLVIFAANFAVFRIASRSMSTTPCYSSNSAGTICRVRTVNWKAVRTTVIVTTNESLCWLVYIVAVMWNTWCGGCHPKQVTWIVYALNSTSVLTNPVIYGVFNRHIRRVVGKTLRKLCGLTT